jgi:hypothetical protein
VQFLLLLLPFWGLELFIIPAVLWVIVPARWHLLLAIVFGLCGMLIVGFWLRRVLREAAEARTNPAAHANWRWSEQLPPDRFRAQLSMFLQLRGWRMLSSGVGDRERVEMVAKKDRWSIVMVCVGPDQTAACGDDVNRVATMQREAGAAYAVIVSSDPRASAAINTVAAAKVMKLGFDDLARFDNVLGLHL